MLEDQHRCSALQAGFGTASTSNKERDRPPFLRELEGTADAPRPAQGLTCPVHKSLRDYCGPAPVSPFEKNHYNK
jgi:hypothetical protein